MVTTLDSYSEANRDSYSSLQAAHPSSTTALSALGQSFTNLVGSYTLNSAQFYLSKFGLPVGNLVACLYSHSGTYGSSSVPNTLLATSDPIAMASLTTSYVLYTFIFTGAQQVALTSGAYYCIVLLVQSATTLDTDNYPRAGWDGSSPSHSGNYFWYRSSAWTANNGRDICFYVYGDAVVSGVKPSSGSIIPQLLMNGILQVKRPKGFILKRLGFPKLIPRVVV